MLLAAPLLVIALSSLAGAVTLAIASAATSREWPARLMRWAMALAVLLLLSILAARALSSGRAPWTNLQETAMTFATALLALYLLLGRRWQVPGLAPLVALLAAALVTLALAQPDEVRPLVPALQAPLLLTVHVGSAMLAYALGGLAFAAAVAEIAQRRLGGRAAFLPTADAAQAAAHRAVLLGFPLLTAAIALGAVWANLAWRSYWSNDPKELAAAATWLVYAGYLHAAGRSDGWGRLAPWLLVLGFAGIVFTYLGAGLVFVGEHSYAGS